MSHWQFKHSIESSMGRSDVWDYCTNFENQMKMESTIERIELDGPFETGTHGRTVTAHYIQDFELKNVHNGLRYTIFGKTPDESGYLSFTWTFTDIDSGTWITQLIDAEGPAVNDHLPVFEQMAEGAIKK